MMFRFMIMMMAGVSVAVPAAAVEADAVAFARDIQPLLSKHCFACHGPDEESREADLRLDERDAAVESGVIVPGQPDASELLRRVLSEDPDERMPPAQTGTALSVREQNLLREWIAAGAEYTPHWAFVRPEHSPVPHTRQADRVRNPIDAFVFARLDAEGLEPVPPADRYTLVRRLYLDLIGLPPDPQQADAFVHSTDPDALEHLVDDLLRSPHYGERWARDWLDLARYADTNGYEKDRPRSIWPWRDWVIRALNADMPFDRFTVEQLAGDMLPGATAEQYIATGFHRNTMLNEEGGIDPLEYRFYAMVDRVATTGTVWLGLTVGCAQCHSHKFDPISQTDYYRMMALLNNADETDYSIPDPEVMRTRRELQRQIDRLEAELPERFPPEDGPGPEAERRRRHYESRFLEWLDEQQKHATRWTVLRPHTVRSNLPRLEVLEDGSVFSTGDITKRDVYTLVFRLEPSSLPVTALRLEVLPDDRLPGGGPGRTYYEGRKGDFFLSELTGAWNGDPITFSSASHSYGKISIGSGDADAGNVLDDDGSTGWSTSGRQGQADQLVVNLSEPLTSAGELTLEMLFERHFASPLGRFRVSVTSRAGPVTAKTIPVDVEAILTRPQTTWTDEERLAVHRRFCRTAPELAAARQQIDELVRNMPPLPQTMVFHERPDDNRRSTFRHHRGEYLSPKERVVPGLPEVFASASPVSPSDRLEFAQWLVSEHNPLAARVAVNRAWQAFFGTGLVSTSDDFGTQGAPPSHPELLDWLAVRFMDDGWSMKSLHRLIVTSATYQLSANASPELRRRDPQNRLLGRASRLRLNAETIRDVMLHASGLLATKMYGPGVYPPQPESVTALAWGSPKWTPSTGPDRWRRSLYTFAKRTAPFAAYHVFDAPTGETCVARRNRSNTPLQALTLLNDDMFLEMARAAVRHVKPAEERNGNRSGSEDMRETAVRLFRRFLTRPPTDTETTVMLDFHAAQCRRLRAGELDAAVILASGADTQPEAGEDTHRDRLSGSRIEQAAWVMLARVLMNLDEAIVRP